MDALCEAFNQLFHALIVSVLNCISNNDNIIKSLSLLARIACTQCINADYLFSRRTCSVVCVFHSRLTFPPMQENLPAAGVPHQTL